MFKGTVKSRQFSRNTPRTEQGCVSTCRQHRGIWRELLNKLSPGKDNIGSCWKRVVLMFFLSEALNQAELESVTAQEKGNTTFSLFMASFPPRMSLIHSFLSRHLSPHGCSHTLVFREKDSPKYKRKLFTILTFVILIF